MLSQEGLGRAANGRTTSAKKDEPASTLVRREIRLVGTTPLLMNRLSEETLLRIRNKTKSPRTAAPPTPREECEDKVHMHDGSPCVPAQNLLASLIAAGQYVRLDGKRQVSTAKSTMLPAFLSLEEPFLYVVDPETGKPATWEVDMRAGKSSTGDVVCICRPRFDRWSILVTVQIDLANIGEHAIRELVDIAARRIGLGDWRPQRKGIMGMFRIDAWKPASTS